MRKCLLNIVLCGNDFEQTDKAVVQIQMQTEFWSGTMSQSYFAAQFLLLALLCNFWTHVYIFAAFLCSLYFAQIYQILKSLGNGPCTTHTKQSDVQQQNFIFLCLKRTLSVFLPFFHEGSPYLWGLYWKRDILRKLQ